MSSNTFILTGKSSKLSCNIFPEVVLDDQFEYSCALLELTTYHSIPNVNQSNNRFYFYFTSGLYNITTYDGNVAENEYEKNLHMIDLPTGCYEADEILDYIKQSMDKYGFSFEYEINKNTFKTKIKCSTSIYIGNLRSNNILKKIFGFSQNKVILKNTTESSTDIIKISSQDVIRVECDIATGSYINGDRCHAIYEFATNKVEVGHKIIERPRNLIYLPVAVRRLNHIEISLVDQNGELIDLRGETVTCCIHIKKN